MELSKSEKTKNFIIQQSSGVFNTKGYAGTSMQDIMEATGLTKGGIYGNFQSKEEIAFLVFDYNVKKIMDKVGKLIRAERNAPDKLFAIIQFYKSYYFNPPIAGGCPMLNMAIEADDTHPALRVRVMNALDILKNSLVHILKKGQEHKQIKDIDIAKFATIFVAVVEGGIMMSRTYQDFKYLNDCLSHLSERIESIRA